MGYFDQNAIISEPVYGSGQTFSYTGTAGTSSALTGGNKVLVWCTTDAYVAVGVSATADSGSVAIPAFTPIVLPAVGGARVSAKQISAGGNCYFTALS